jgi:hypothetical protein
MNALVTALNALAQAWTNWMVSMSWQFVVLVLAAAIVSVALRRRPAALRCLIWLLVFAKLVLPPWLATPWSAGNLLASLPVGIQWKAMRTSAYDPCLWRRMSRGVTRRSRCQGRDRAMAQGRPDAGNTRCIL